MENSSEMVDEDIEMADIARGRRITAVAASDLQLTQRRSERPAKKSNKDTFIQRLYRANHIPGATQE